MDSMIKQIWGLFLLLAARGNNDGGEQKGQVRRAERHGGELRESARRRGSDTASGLQIAPDEGFELGLGGAGIEASLNEVATGLVERGLRVEHVEQR